MIVSTELIQNIDQLSTKELAWLSGYCWAKSKVDRLQSFSADLDQASTATATTTRTVTILSASQTGNANRVAERLHESLQSLPVRLQHYRLGDYKNKQITEEDIVIFVSSTQGEGEFPEEAISFSKYLFGKRAPNLEHLSFAVVGLGDSSYPLFCEASKKWDERLEALGAKRLLPRLDNDVDYEDSVTQWQEQLHACLSELLHNETPAVSSPAVQITPASKTYDRTRPYLAELIQKQKITARQANKNTLHIEIDLGDSGIQYSPGDSLGILPTNNTDLVQDFLALFDFKPEALVQLKSGQSLPLIEALTHHVELTQNSVALVKKWAQISQHPELIALVEHPEKAQHYASVTPLYAMIQAYPATIDPQQWFAFLRPLSPRMYSIASAQAEVGAEVHITLGVVEYTHQQKHYRGVCSDYLCAQLEEGDTLPIFIEPNPRFRLPHDPNTPIIMIGAGTGIAPYRAFMQQREQDQAQGRAWLIFGNQKFTDDFLYQSEWQRWHQLGFLHKASLAWSRQNPQQKVYVQDKIRAESAELWQWLSQGAHVYVCGDANQMAKEVEQALLHVIAHEGQLNSEQSEQYLDELRDNGRYQRDVY